MERQVGLVGGDVLGVGAGLDEDGRRGAGRQVDALLDAARPRRTCGLVSSTCRSRSRPGSPRRRVSVPTSSHGV